MQMTRKENTKKEFVLFLPKNVNVNCFEEALNILHQLELASCLQYNALQPEPLTNNTDCPILRSC